MNYLTTFDTVMITLAVIICLYVMLSDDNNTPRGT